jgi:hypothetical protein
MSRSGVRFSEAAPASPLFVDRYFDATPLRQHEIEQAGKACVQVSATRLAEPAGARVVLAQYASLAQSRVTCTDQPVMCCGRTGTRVSGRLIALRFAATVASVEELVGGSPPTSTGQRAASRGPR